MPSSWSSLTPILSIKRAFSSHRSKKDKKGRRSSPSPPPSISSLLPIQSFPSPSVSQPVVRFSRRDEHVNARTRKYLNQSSIPSTSQSIPTPTVSHRTSSPSPLIPRRPITPTQQWPSPSTLLEWMEPSLTERREEWRRVRTLSEGNPSTPSRSPFYSSDSIALPTRTFSKEELDRRGRGTTERVAAWIRSKSRERMERMEGGDRGETREWKRTCSDKWKKRVPVLSSRSRSIDNLSYSMPAAAGCTACMTKYSLLNREEGCSGCALSFCKKCVQWKAVLPRLSPKPLSVCLSCFERIEKEKKAEERKSYSHTMTSTPLYPSVPSSTGSSQSTSYFAPRPSPHPSIPFNHSLPPSQSDAPPSYSSSVYPSNLNRPWWNDNELPPPSMRSEYGRGVVQPRPLVKGMPVPPVSSSSFSSTVPSRPPVSAPQPSHGNELAEMEERAKKLRDDADVPPPSLASLEERLAALRGVDVELVRNPRSYFETKGGEKRGDTVEKLMEEARSMAILEEKNDPDRLLEERANRLMDRKEEEKKEEGDENEVRLSMAPSVSSRISEFSEATKEELADIDRLMAEAKKRVEETEGRVERENNADEGRKEGVNREMGEANRLATQLSLDVAKVNEEMATFWKKENEKRNKEESSDEELDDETLASIVREAEMTEDEPIVEKKTVNPSEASPEKKKGLFGRMFKKMSSLSPLVQGRIEQARSRFSIISGEDYLLPRSFIHLLPIDPLSQNGPQCGLVALTMGLRYLTEEETTVSDLFTKAVKRGFTKQGEMFEAADLLSLSLHSSISSTLLTPLPSPSTVVQSILDRSLLLIPYDCDRNHEPSMRQGVAAHWALIVGVLVITTESGELTPFPEDVTPLLSDISSDRLYVLAYHGKSKHLGVWSYSQLVASNGQLTQLGETRKEEEFIVKDSSLGGLRDKCLLLQSCNNE